MQGTSNLAYEFPAMCGLVWRRMRRNNGGQKASPARICARVCVCKHKASAWAQSSSHLTDPGRGWPPVVRLARVVVITHRRARGKPLQHCIRVAAQQCVWWRVSNGARECYEYLCMCSRFVRACVHACVRACVRACMRACMRAGGRAHACNCPVSSDAAGVGCRARAICWRCAAPCVGGPAGGGGLRWRGCSFLGLQPGCGLPTWLCTRA